MHPTYQAEGPTNILLPFSQSFQPQLYSVPEPADGLPGTVALTNPHTSYQGRPGVFGSGLHTPPPDMASDLSSILPQNYSNSSFDKRFHPSTGRSNNNYKNTTNTTSYSNVILNPEQNNHSRSQPRSPVTKRDVLTVLDQNQPRSKGTSSNDIVSYLQIPSSINDSKGSLAEFAAQITCLFWFESASTLRRVEESEIIPFPHSPLVPEAIPKTGFLKWVTTILSTTQVSQNVILLSLLFVYRLKTMNPQVKGKPGSEFRLLTVALMLGNKFLDDNTYTNKTWADVSGISVQEIHIMEVEFLSNMRYSLYTSEEEWKKWHVKLARFWDYFNKASRAEPPRPLEPPTSKLALPPALPSPPSSTHTSPPVAPSNSSYYYPLHMSTPPVVQPIPSPSVSLPEFDARYQPRKRSYDETIPEPPLKRPNLSGVQPHLGSQPPSSGSLSNVPRLPIPQLSLSTTTPPYRGSSQVTTQLPPLQGKAMSMVFRGPSEWTAPLSSPSSIQSNGSSLPMVGFTDRQQSPYPSSNNSSPTSTFYPAGIHPQSHLSPSYFLSQRSSPYRPVRQVNTLLVPPPSSSLANAPRNVSYDQMHYHPLGKSGSELRTGVVPYMHHDTWANGNQVPQWAPFPQPNFST